MCLALPGQVIAVFKRDGVCMGTLDFGGVRKEVCLACVPEVAVGEFAIVHAGFAIGRLDEDSAREALREFLALEDSSS